MITETPTRPVMRYHGGKWMLAPWIIGHFPVHHRYVETHGGAASVLLRKPRSSEEIYNDMDAEIVSLFRVLRHDGDELERLLRLTPYARAEFEEAWLPAPDPIEKARRTLIRSFMGVGTAAATESRDNGRRMTGFRTVSRVGRKCYAAEWTNWIDALPVLLRRFREVLIENHPAEMLWKRYDAEDTLFYVDPPYVMSSRGDVEADYRHEMTDDDHRALAAQLKMVKGKVLLSGYHSPLYDELYDDWERVERAALADGGRKRTEVLWMNFKPEGRLI